MTSDQLLIARLGDCAHPGPNNIYHLRPADDLVFEVDFTLITHNGWTFNLRNWPGQMGTMVYYVEVTEP